MLKCWFKTTKTIGISILFLFVSMIHFSFANHQSLQNKYSPDPVKEKLRDIYQSSGIGAIAFVLVENGKVISAGGFGQYNNKNHKPVTENSLFRVGSITKTFTAIAIMEQVEKGNLKLTQSIKSIVKDIPLSNPYSSPVTIQMLLEHTSGLEDLTAKEFNFPRPLSLQQAFRISPTSRRVMTPPGYHFNYTNAGAGYLGRAIEVVNHVDYDAWFKTEILTRMGMKHSTLKWSKDLEEKLVSGYDADLKTRILYWHTLFRPFGGLNTTAMDMSRLLILFTRDRTLNTRQIISNNALETMETPATSLGAKAGLKQGYALGIRNQLFRGHRIYGHGGDADGYLAQFSYSKESHRGYFFVINAFRHDIDEKFTFLLNQWLVAPLIHSHSNLQTKNSQKKEMKLSDKAFKRISGKYVEVTRRFPGKKLKTMDKVFIKKKGEKIQICFKKIMNCQPLFVISNQLFKTKRDSEASIAIVKAGDGKIYLQWGSDSYQKISLPL